MKTNFRIWALGVGITNLALCVGCGENQAHESLAANAAPAYSLGPITDEAAPAAPAPAKPGEPPVPVVVNEPPVAEQPVQTPAPAAAPASIVITKANATKPAGAVTNATNVAVVTPVSTTAEPPKISPALSEVVRLLQANVNQDVVLAYITNSTQPFYIGANEIVFLHDLGAPPTVVTSLINFDATPEMQARKQAAVAAKPLPTGVALTEPAPIFPPRTTQVAPNPPEPQPVNPPANAGTVLSPPPQDTTVTYDYPAPAEEVNYSYFYNSLSPYGTWSDVPGYGSCWRPTCATWNSSWRPYSDGGHWLWTDHGWYWYSDYSWGWAPFHYGRWCQPAGYGWVWQPDTCWGPSWVSWRYSANYCGWAPLPPSACYVSGLGFYYNSGSVGIGFEFGLGAADYCYVSSAHFCDPHVHNYCLPPHQNQIVHKDTTVVNNYVLGNNNRIINNGMGVDKVARVTRGDIKRVALKDTTSVKSLGTRHDRLEADGSTLTVYRPPSAVLARKSAISTSGQPNVSVSRPPTSVRPAGTSAGSTHNTSVGSPAAGSGSPAAGTKSYIGSGVANPRTTPSPVTVYTRPSSAANEPVIVTGGVPPPLPSTYVKPEGLSASGSRVDRPPVDSRGTTPAVAGDVRQHDPSALKDAAGNPRSAGAYSKPAAASGSGAHVSTVPGGDNSSRVAGKPPVAPGGGAGYARTESNPAYTKPAAPPAASSQNSAPAYTHPPTVAPSHNPSYATPSAGYVAPSHSETHHSQVAPSGGHSGGSTGGGSTGGGGGHSSGSSGSTSSGSSGGKSSDSGSSGGKTGR